MLKAKEGVMVKRLGFKRNHCIKEKIMMSSGEYSPPTTRKPSTTTVAI
jgi:hypothetical protein